MSNWVNDFETECHNGSLTSPKCLEIGIQFFGQFLPYFPEDSNALRFRAELATRYWYYYAGRLEESKSRFTILSLTLVPSLDGSRIFRGFRDLRPGGKVAGLAQPGRATPPSRVGACCHRGGIR